MGQTAQMAQTATEQRPAIEDYRLLIALARQDFLTFCRVLYKGFETSNHHRTLAAALHAVEQGKIKRLLVCEPPRHGKSMLISQLFPCWFLGKHPEANIIQSGYSHEIAMYHSRLARRFFGSSQFKAVFPEVLCLRGPAEADVNIDPLRQLAHEWGTVQGGRYYAVGVGGGITGRGADLLILDDPIKNREEANSITIRQRIYDWYRSTFYTRLTPDGRIIIIMTRWHPHDLAGTLLTEMECGGEQWTVLKCPALNEKGEALWPSRWPVELLLEKKRTLGSVEFEALYQQNPHVKEGAMFERAWFGLVDEAPADCRKVRFWDFAATKKVRTGHDPDWTVGALVGLARDGRWYLIDIQRIRGTPLEVERLVKQTAELDGRAVEVCLEQEPGSSGVAMIDHYRRSVLVGWTVRVYKPEADKTIRAKPMSAAAEAGNFKLVRGRWNVAFLEEVELFPIGPHDDQVDAVSGAMQALSGSLSNIWADVERTVEQETAVRSIDLRGIMHRRITL